MPDKSSGPLTNHVNLNRIEKGIIVSFITTLLIFIIGAGLFLTLPDRKIARQVRDISMGVVMFMMVLVTVTMLVVKTK